MDRIYAQIVYNNVGLIGKEAEGLPLPESFLLEHPEILNIDITDMTIKPNLGDFYKDGVFYTPEEWNEKYPQETQTVSPVQPTNAQIAQQISDLEANLIIAGVI